jgi:hypothetical protein
MPNITQFNKMITGCRTGGMELDAIEGALFQTEGMLALDSPSLLFIEYP